MTFNDWLQYSITMQALRHNVALELEMICLSAVCTWETTLNYVITVALLFAENTFVPIKQILFTW